MNTDTKPDPKPQKTDRELLVELLDRVVRIETRQVKHMLAQEVQPKRSEQ